MGLVEEVRARGGDIRLTDLNETVHNIFQVVGFDHIYRLFGSEREAIESFRSGSA